MGCCAAFEVGSGPKTKASSKVDPDAPARSNPLGLEVSPDVLEFIEALDRFKIEHGRPFPNWSEVLHVLKQLGYAKR